ncbi:MAG: hypothetical protein K0S85_4443 [Pseudomonas orientalis]|nr:hypothetical protein [Pseudomonas orientalis]
MGHTIGPAQCCLPTGSRQKPFCQGKHLMLLLPITGLVRAQHERERSDQSTCRYDSGEVLMRMPWATRRPVPCTPLSMSTSQTADTVHVLTVCILGAEMPCYCRRTSISFGRVVS